MTSKTVAILGPGAIGGFLAAMFWNAGIWVTCIAKPDRVHDIAHNGIFLESKRFGSFLAKPFTTEFLHEAPDFLFITTKAGGLRDAMARIDPISLKNAVVIPLLNGIEHMAVLRSSWGMPVIAGTISIEASQLNKGHVIHSSSFVRMRLGADDMFVHVHIPEVIALLNNVGIEARDGGSEAHVLWEKLVRLNALALMTSATGKSIGEIRTDSGMCKELETLVKEAATVAHAENAIIMPDDVMKQLKNLEPQQRSSLKRDLDAGNELELDAIAGSIVRAGKRHHLACPTIERYIETIIHMHHS